MLLQTKAAKKNIYVNNFSFSFEAFQCIYFFVHSSAFKQLSYDDLYLTFLSTIIRLLTFVLVFQHVTVFCYSILLILIRIIKRFDPLNLLSCIYILISNVNKEISTCLKKDQYIHFTWFCIVEPSFDFIEIRIEVVGFFV